MASQLVLTAIGYYAAFEIRFDFRIPPAALQRFAATLPYLLLLRVALTHKFRLDRSYWAHVGVPDLLRLTAAASLGSVLFPAALLGLRQLHGLPASVLLIEWLLAIALPGGIRFAVRCLREGLQQAPARPGKRTLIVGAGDAGEQILRQLQHDPRCGVQVVGLVDDDPAKVGRELHGVPVLGVSADLRRLAVVHEVNQVLIAIPSIGGEDLRRLVERCMASGVEVRLLPPLKELVESEVHLSQLREVQIEDLLGREPVDLDLRAIEPEIAGRVVVVTGAGGSIGSELARQIARFHPRELVLIERAESPLHYIHLEVTRAHPEIHAVPVLASVTNSERMRAVFAEHRPDLVFHAAAYKHVPMLEWNMIEGVWNNVIGTLCIARAAARAGARKFVLISTDKAVNPTSVLGATKFIAERVVRELPSLRASATDFRVVRFGNVLGSDGSVLPLFKQQLAAGGPLTVTHPEVRRYFMTIPEAVQLVLQAAALPEAAGRIALLEMGSQIRIVDLAEQLVRLAGLLPYQDVDIVFTGLRPGEKLEEELIGPGETAQETAMDKIRLVDRDGNQGEELARRLRALTRVTARRDEQGLLRALAALAPDYRPGLPASPYPAYPHGLGNGNGHRHANRNGHRRATGNGNGHANGNGNGYHSATGNGHVNATGNGHGNGNGNGHRNGNGNGKLPPVSAPVETRVRLIQAQAAAPRNGHGSQGAA